MENTTRLLARHEDILARRHWLMVNANDPALLHLPGAGRAWHSDRLALAGQEPAMLPRLSADTDLVIVVLPKSLQRLQMLVASVAAQLSGNCELWLVGPAKGGIKGGVSSLARQGIHLDSIDSARHCKLFAGRLSPGTFDLSRHEQHFSLGDLSICSYPGVFSEGRLDAGTALLLEALSGEPVPASALDLGCGAGVISAWLAARQVRVTAVDVSATAIEATRRTLSLNHLDAEVMQGDLFDRVTGRFDWLVTNPPFHQGREQTLEVTRRLVRGAAAHLNGNGALWLVANRHLPYGDWLHEAFERVEIVAQDNAFTVYRARRG